MSAAVGPRGKRVQTPQQVRTPAAPLAAPLAVLPVVPREQSVALAHAAKGVEALGVLVQYLVFRVSISMPLILSNEAIPILNRKLKVKVFLYVANLSKSIKRLNNFISRR